MCNCDPLTCSRVANLFDLLLVQSQLPAASCSAPHTAAGFMCTQSRGLHTSFEHLANTIRKTLAGPSDAFLGRFNVYIGHAVRVCLIIPQTKL